MQHFVFRHFLGRRRYRRIVAELRRQIFELKAGGADDPDGLRTAAVLNAYFQAEHAKVFRRLLWRRLAIAALILSVVALTSHLLSHGAALAGFLIVGLVAGWAAFLEWSADSRLGALLADSRSTSRSVTYLSGRTPTTYKDPLF
jgi:hypothetical protein